MRLGGSRRIAKQEATKGAICTGARAYLLNDISARACRDMSAPL